VAQRYDEQLELDAALVAVNAPRPRRAHDRRPDGDVRRRDVRFMKRIADDAGVQIVACTGIYSYDYLPHYFENATST